MDDEYDGPWEYWTWVGVCACAEEGHPHDFEGCTVPDCDCTAHWEE